MLSVLAKIPAGQPRHYIGIPEADGKAKEERTGMVQSKLEGTGAPGWLSRTCGS